MVRLCFTLFLLFSSQAFSQEKQYVTIYSYHLKPPLVVNRDTQHGLYFDFARYLNSHSEKYRFDLAFVPRKRVDKMLEDGNLDGILLGVNPNWFQDKEEKRYFWTPRIFTDRDEIVSLKTRPFEYINANSLAGKIFGGVRGFYYFGINELVKQNKIARVNTVRETDLFTMLLNKRIDAAVISRSTYDYMINLYQWQDKFYLSHRPHDIYDRRVLVPKQYQDIFQYITPIIEQLQFSEQWQQTIDSYKKAKPPKTEDSSR